MNECDQRKIELGLYRSGFELRSLRRNSILAGRRVRPVHTTDLLVRDTARIVSVYGDEKSQYRWKMVGSATTYGID